VEVKLHHILHGDVLSDSLSERFTTTYTVLISQETGPLVYDESKNSNTPEGVIEC
jgi:hypothetical protein